MNDIFLTFLSLSVSGSLLAVFLFLLKPIIKTRLSKSWQYYIYMIVILRLLLPFGSETGLMGIVFNHFENNVVADDNSVAMQSIDKHVQLPNETSKEQLKESTYNSPIPAKSIGKTLLSWLWLLWLIPAALLLLRKVVSYYHYTNAIKSGCNMIADQYIQNIYQETLGVMNIKHAPGLSRNEQVPAPMLIGLIHPRIVLPEDEVKETEMHFIFRHELIHYKRLDIVYKWLVQIVLCLHWFNPVVYWVRREVNRNCELSCDEVIIRQLDKKSRYAYGDMLLRAIKFEKMSPRVAVSITLSEDKKLIKERLGAIMTHKKQSGIIIMLSVLLAIFLLCGASFAGVYAAEPESINSIELGTKKSRNIPNTQKSSVTSVNTPITINEVEMRFYEDDDPNGRWPYVHWLISNNSDKTITDYKMVLLAYDKNGNPMELAWNQFALTDGKVVTGYTSQSKKAYEQFVTLAEQPILPGSKEKLDGGWTLWDGWNQAKGTHDVAYLLACMKQVTFEDDTVWKNPEYKHWMKKYKGKTVAVETIAD